MRPGRATSAAKIEATNSRGIRTGSSRPNPSEVADPRIQAACLTRAVEAIRMDAWTSPDRPCPHTPASSESRGVAPCSGSTPEAGPFLRRPDPPRLPARRLARRCWAWACPALQALEAQGAVAGDRDINCIMLFLVGGPVAARHLGPEARRPRRDPRAVPADRRPRCPGVQITEIFPRLAGDDGQGVAGPRRSTTRRRPSTTPATR